MICADVEDGWAESSDPPVLAHGPAGFGRAPESEGVEPEVAELRPGPAAVDREVRTRGADGNQGRAALARHERDGRSVSGRAALDGRGPGPASVGGRREVPGRVVGALVVAADRD